MEQKANLDKEDERILQNLLKTYEGTFKNVEHEDGDAILHAATRTLRFKVVEEILNLGVEINPKDYADMTPLHASVALGHIEIVKLLLDHGADINAQDKNDETPLDIAIEYGYNSIIQLLSKRGGKIYSFLRLTDKMQMETILDMFLTSKANPDVQDIGNYTFLHLATDEGINIENDFTIVKTLLKSGASVNATNNFGYTPLHVACTFYKDERYVKELLQYGANVNARLNDGATPLHEALKYAESVNNGGEGEPVRIVETVLQYGKDIDFNFKDEDGMTILDLAIQKKFHRIGRMIAKRMCPKPKITDSIYPLKLFL